jgi:hypothetical protein
MKKTIAVAALTAVVASTTVLTSGPATAAKKYTACVKKSTGEVRLLVGGTTKCKKGWKKTTWKKAGPRGDKGPDGAAGTANSLGTVVDGNGQVVGQAVGLFSFGVMLFQVRIDGGIYEYAGNGWLMPKEPEAYYDNATCSGEPFTVTEDSFGLSVMQSDPGLRIVYRVFLPSMQPARAWKVQGSPTSVINLNRWGLDVSGACVATTPFTGYRVPLAPVTAPPDHPGPLRVA